MTEKVIPRLVVVIDRSGCYLPIVDAALQALGGGADQIQLREPELEHDAYLALARELIAQGIPSSRLTVNGHPLIASELDTNLHLPERMLGSVKLPLSGRGLISASIHGPRTGPEAGFDYFIAGNAVETGSKAGKPGYGVTGMTSIVASCSGPVLAIGGMTPETLGDFLRAGAWGVAVRSWVIGSRNPEQATRTVREELNRWTT